MFRWSCSFRVDVFVYTGDKRIRERDEMNVYSAYECVWMWNEQICFPLLRETFYRKTDTYFVKSKIAEAHRKSPVCWRFLQLKNVLSIVHLCQLHVKKAWVTFIRNEVIEIMKYFRKWIETYLWGGSIPSLTWTPFARNRFDNANIRSYTRPRWFYS